MAAPKQTEAQQAGILVWGRIAARLSRAIAPLLIVRLLGQAEVGHFATLMLVYETVAIFLTAGFPGSVLYFFAGRSLAERKGTAIRFVSLMTVMAAVMGLVLTGVGLWGLSWLSWLSAMLPEGLVSVPEVPGPTLRLLPWMGFYAVFDLPVRLLPNLLLAEQRARSSAGAALVHSLGVVIATFVPLALGLGVPGIVVGLIVFGAAYWSAMLVALRRMYRGAKAEYPVGNRELFNYSIPLGLTDIVGNINKSFDLWVIVVAFSAVEVAEYQAGAWQIPVITTIAFSTGSAYLTRYALLHKAGQGAEAMAIWRNLILKVSLVVVPCAMVFVVAAEEFIVLAMTADYIEAAPVFRWYCVLTMGRVTAFGGMMLAAGRPGYVLQASLFSLVSNVCISLPLFFAFGFVGPAMGTTLAFIPTVFFYCWFIARAWGVDLQNTFPVVGYFKVVAVCLVPAACAWVAKGMFASPLAGLLVAAAVVVLGFALLGTFTGLIGRDEWRYVREWLSLKVLR